jgi:hypothetical protein
LYCKYWAYIADRYLYIFGFLYDIGFKQEVRGGVTKVL